MVSTTRIAAGGIAESDALLSGMSEAERGAIARALEFASAAYGAKKLGTGEPAREHALGLARNAAGLRLDADARVAGLLFSIPEYVEGSGDKLKAKFGATVASLVAGIAALNRLRVATRAAALEKDSGA